MFYEINLVLGVLNLSNGSKKLIDWAELQQCKAYPGQPSSIPKKMSSEGTSNTKLCEDKKDNKTANNTIRASLLVT